MPYGLNMVLHTEGFTSMRKIKFLYALLTIFFFAISNGSAEITELVIDYSYTKSAGNWINYRAEISKNFVNVSFYISTLKIIDDKMEQNCLEDFLSFEDTNSFYKLKDTKYSAKISEHGYDFFDYENSLVLTNGSQKCICIISNWEDILNRPDYLHELNDLMEMHVKILSMIAAKLNCEWTDLYSRMDMY